MTDLIGHLVKLGLSEYEAKAYVATVALGEGTIKEISDESKVPRSRTYDVMERLLQRGFVEVGNATPRCYRANEPSDALNHLMEEIRGSKDEVLRALNEIGRKAETRENPIWTIKGEWAIDHKVQELFETATKNVNIIIMSNTYLLRYAKYIAKASEGLDIKVMTVHKADDFVAILGKADIFQVDNNELDHSMLWVKDTRGLVTMDEGYSVGMVMICDHRTSLVLTREGEGHRAILSSGTIVDYIIDRLLNLSIKDYQQQQPLKKKGRK